MKALGAELQRPYRNRDVPRILLVDDDRNLLELLERGFRFEGFRVMTARDGPGCFEELAREPPDVVLLSKLREPRSRLGIKAPPSERSASIPVRRYFHRATR